MWHFELHLASIGQSKIPDWPGRLDCLAIYAVSIPVPCIHTGITLPKKKKKKKVIP